MISGMLAVRDGRLREAAALTANRARRRQNPAGAQFSTTGMALEVRGPTPAAVAEFKAALAAVPFKDIPMVDRPYFDAVRYLSIAGDAAGARAMLARYRAETTDTAFVREQEPYAHQAEGYIAIAEGKPRDAIALFRKGDISYDGGPVDECAACLPLQLARAYDAAAMADSAILMYEQYLKTGTFFKYNRALDPVALAATHERLGQLYEAKNDAGKAAEHYRTFIDLWKNADPDLQPRVTEAKRRLAKLTPVERPR